jgi:hypothetical protein
LQTKINKNQSNAKLKARIKKVNQMIENYEFKIKKKNFAIIKLKKKLENLQTIKLNDKLQVEYALFKLIQE